MDCYSKLRANRNEETHTEEPTGMVATIQICKLRSALQRGVTTAEGSNKEYNSCVWHVRASDVRS